VSHSRVAVAEARGQFRNLEEGERLLLEAVPRRLVMSVTEDTRMCVTVNCTLYLRVVRKSSVNLITNPTPVYIHCNHVTI
jgi:hypothetical protein